MEKGIPMLGGLFKVAVASTLATGAAYAQSAPAGSPTEPAAAPAASADDAAALAQKLSNPVSSLISVPFQLNYDARIGPLKDGERLTINVQPVIPFSISKDWNLVSRTIVPIVWQSDIFPGSGNQFGLGDTVQSFFFTPKQAKGIIWGAGPVILLPTGTDQLLSGHKWGVGPTAVVLKQAGQWTIGGLANHIWSVAGDNNRNDLSLTYFNPFISHTSKTAFTVGASADLTYDWKIDKLVMPVNLTASQLVKVNKQLLSLGGGLRYYVATTDASPHGLAARLSITLLYPAK